MNKIFTYFLLSILFLSVDSSRDLSEGDCNNPGLIKSTKKVDRDCVEYNDAPGCNHRLCSKICICRHLELYDTGCENDHTCWCSYPCIM